MIDLILYNGNIITVDERNPRVEAVAIKGNKINIVGSNQEILMLKDEKTKVVDLSHSTVPGKKYLYKPYTESDCQGGQKEAFTWFSFWVEFYLADI